MTEYDYTQAVNLDKLGTEILAASLPYLSANTLGTGSSTAVSVFMTRDLTTGEKTSLDAVMAAHNPTDTATYIKNKILAAMVFGQQIMAEYGAQNVMAGRSVSDIQIIMAETNKVQAALLSGSLYVALTELANIIPDGILVTQSTLDTFRHKIQDYLGIPRT